MAQPIPPFEDDRTLPSTIITNAISLITGKGWCQGQNPKSPPIGDGDLWHARDAQGNPVRMFRGQQDKETLNPEVNTLTLYGAIALCLNSRDARMQQTQLLWQTVQQEAAKRTPGIAIGGTNYLHPIFNYNETPGRTQADILDFLNTVKTTLLAIEQGAMPAQQPAAVEPLKVELVGPVTLAGRLDEGSPMGEIAPPALSDELIAPPAKKPPKGKGGRPQPQPVQKPNLPPPKTKTPVKKIRKMKSPTEDMKARARTIGKAKGRSAGKGRRR